MLAQEKAGDKSIIIIDSMNAIKEFLDIPDTSLELEKALMNLVDSYGFSIVLIFETEKETKIDYLADGVITLTYSIVNGGIIRKLIINKLRGIEIKEVEFLFTLSESEFTILSMLPRFFELNYAKLPKVEILKEENKVYQLPLNLGFGKKYELKVPLGTSVLAEVDPKIPFRYFFITDFIGINLVRQGITWFFGSALQYDIDRTYNLLKTAYADNNELSEKFIGIVPQHQRIFYKRIPRKVELFEVTEDINETINMLITKIEDKRAHPFYMTLVLDIFETTLPGSKLIDFVERIIRIVSMYNSLAILITFSTFKQIDYLKGLFEYHFKFDLLNGTMIARLLKPVLSRYYGLIFEEKDGFPEIKLYPIS
ncbi:MAG: gas vesicle protein GvpD P-loop domain-containing protein [Candidatus Asgardarchaeia archaeon]